MEILDAQLHCWLSDRPGRPWRPGYRRELAEQRLNVLLQTAVPMTPETLLVEMAAAGVDGGVLTPQGVYGTDNNLELTVAAEYPRKFVAVGLIDPGDRDHEATLTADAERGMLGVRLLGEQVRSLAGGELTGAMDRCAELGLAVALTLPHPIPAGLADVLARYASTRFMIDHVGVGFAPPANGIAPPEPFERLPAVIELARHPNVSLKLTGASALSHEPYPFRDVWDPVLQLVAAFGAARVMWGSDITRTGSLATYAEHTHYLREIAGLGEEQLGLLYAGALRGVLDWPPDAYLRRAPFGGAP